MSVENSKPKSRFPRKMLIFTGLVAVVVFVANWQAFALNERFNLATDMLFMMTGMAVMFLFMAWVLWAFFFGKFRMLAVLSVLIAVGFFTLYYPNFTGDMGIAGFKPRFWNPVVDYVEPASATTEAATSVVDLRTTTPNDFPQFLGPNRNAIIDTVKLANWDVPPTEVWRFPIGEGWSGFVAVNGNAVTQEQRETDECVSCYDITTGELRWIRRSTRRVEDGGAMGKVGPRATPTIDQGLVYATSGTGVLDCLDGATGDLVWSADVPKLVGIDQVVTQNSAGLEYTTETSHMAWARSNSPLIVDEMVVIPAGGPDKLPADGDPTSTLIAFDKTTGVEKWRGGTRMISYGSPTLATIGGKRQILLIAENCAVGHDAATGEELWSHERPGNSHMDANCSQVTVVDDSHLLLSKGYGLGGELIEVSEKGGKWLVKSLQKDPRILKTKLTNPVIHNGHAYSLSDGYLECAEVNTFTKKWKQRGRFGNGQILLVGDKLLVHSEFGTLYLIESNPDDYTELSSFDTIKGTCWNTLCLYGDLILVRSELEAACFRLPTELR